ncbi:MAG TPA: hypothetical protein VMZ28_18310 [Kofleriaceae bacterium]|nr:hypothetical protein [Kofleriaceae bacterium]
MFDLIVSHQAAMWFVTGAALLICAIWGARDVYLLVRKLPAARASSPDPAAWRDQVFGSVVGVIIIGLGIYGVIRYWQHH